MDEEALLLAGAAVLGPAERGEGSDSPCPSSGEDTDSVDGAVDNDSGSDEADVDEDEDDHDIWDIDGLRDNVRVEIQEQQVGGARGPEAGEEGDPGQEDAGQAGERRRHHIRVGQRGGLRRGQMELQIQIQLQHPGRREARPIAYDRSLPASHHYLGDNFSRITGGKVYGVKQICTLPLYCSRAHLIPGRTLPFMCDSPRQETMVKQLTSGNDSMFAVMCTPTASVDERRGSRGNTQPPAAGEIGCTAQLTSWGVSDDSSYRVLCKGVQRFRLVRAYSLHTGVVMADVNILAEILPPSFPARLLPLRHQAYRRSPFLRYSPLSRDPRGKCPPTTAANAASTSDTSASSDLLATVASTSGESCTCDNSRQPQAMVVTGMSSATFEAPPDNQAAVPMLPASLVGHVRLRSFQQCSYEVTVARVYKELLPWCTAKRLSRHELTRFSFYAISSIPLDSSTQRALLSMDCALQRLQRLLRLMKPCRNYCCAQCGRVITRRENIISMSDDGPSALYVNPSNIITEMFTSRDTQSFSTAQLLPPSREFSWFPGYAWCCSICISCSNHVGWSFETSDPALSPKQFFGLAQSSVVPDFAAPRNAPSPGPWSGWD